MTPKSFNEHYYRLYNEPSYRLQFYRSYLQRIGQAGRLAGHPGSTIASTEAGKEVMAKENPLFTIVAHGDRKTVNTVYKKGSKHSHYNAKRRVIETITLNEDCTIDVEWCWNNDRETWEFVGDLWETARAVPPPEPEPPSFWAKLWAKLTGRHIIPQARLLKD